MDTSDIKRFWNKVDKKQPYDCWKWLGKARCGKSGFYGQFWLKGKNATPHRVSYELAFGEYDKSMHVLHKCDNPICVNPNHLFLGTNEDNIKDKMSKGRWKGGRPVFVPQLCPRCNRMKQLVRGYCKGCYSTMRRKALGRNGTGPSPF